MNVHESKREVIVKEKGEERRRGGNWQGGVTGRRKRGEIGGKEFDDGENG